MPATDQKKCLFDCLPRVLVFRIFHLASANYQLAQCVKETFCLERNAKKSIKDHFLGHTRLARRKQACRTTRVRSLLVERTYDSVGLFSNARSLSTLLFDFVGASNNRSYLFLLLSHFADTLDHVTYPQSEPMRATRTDLSDLLNEYKEADLQSRRCIRLFEYLNHELFDYDRIVLIFDKRDLQYHAMPCSNAAELFYVRWHANFGYKILPEIEATYGYANELTEHDLSDAWQVSN